MSTKKKVFLGNIHIAYVNVGLMSEFCRVLGIVNYTAWVRQQAFDTYGITLYSKSDLEHLQHCTENDYYDSVGEWLHDRMRTLLREAKKGNR